MGAIPSHGDVKPLAQARVRKTEAVSYRPAFRAIRIRAETHFSTQTVVIGRAGPGSSPDAFVMAWALRGAAKEN